MADGDLLLGFLGLLLGLLRFLPGLLRHLLGVLRLYGELTADIGCPCESRGLGDQGSFLLFAGDHAFEDHDSVSDHDFELQGFRREGLVLGNGFPNFGGEFTIRVGCDRSPDSCGFGGRIGGRTL